MQFLTRVGHIRIFRILIVSICFICCAGCHELDDYAIPCQLVKLESITKVTNGLLNSYLYDNKYYSGQGMAILDNTMYRLYHTGICQSIDMSDIEHPYVISTFKLGSYSSSNHSNCAQFWVDEHDEVYLYVSSVRALNGERGKCFVERIDGQSSSLIQTISVDYVDLLSEFKGVDIICGDDGYLWIFGFNTTGTKMIYAKARKPLVSEGNLVYLSDNDILDYWYDSDYLYNTNVTQGGIVKNGLLFSVFGTSVLNRHIAVYNTGTHIKLGDLDLNAVVSEEPEDCDLWEGKLVLSICGGTGFYIISFSQTSDL